MHSCALARSLVVALLILFTSVVGSAQSQAPPSTSQPTRDPQAIAVVQSAIAALGGVSTVVAITDTTVTGTEPDISNPGGPPVPFTWQTAGVEFCATTQNSIGVYTALSGHGVPAQLKNGNWIPLPPYVSRAELAFYLPALVLFGEIQNVNYTLQYIGPGTVDGNAAIHVHVADNSDATGQLVTAQEWYFDPTSFLPVRVEYAIPDERNVNNSIPASMEFSNYENVSGLAVPFQITIQASDLLLLTANVTSVVFNSGLSASTFDPPVAGAQ
jgi:hypothetical protein